MSKPIRIQLSRKKGFRLPPNTVIVARPSIFGNPYRVQDVIRFYDGKIDVMEATQSCVDAFKAWLDGSAQGGEMKVIIRAKLRGHNLACWCKPGTPCHADVLLKIANS